MGTGASRDEMHSPWHRCIQCRNTLFRSSNGLDISISTRYIAEDDQVLVQPWQILHDDTWDRWKKSRMAADFEPFPVCNRRNTSSQEPKWHTTSCRDARQEKSRSVIVYQIHNSPRHTFEYSSNDTMEKILNDSDLQCIVPSAGDFITFHFVLTSSADQQQGIIVLHQSGTTESMYFVVERSSPYVPRGIAVSPDGTMVCLLISSPQVDTYEVQVYSKRPVAFSKGFQGSSYELEYAIPYLKSSKGHPKIMFDPRYYSSRLGMINVTSVQNIRVTHYFMVYDLKAKHAVIMPHENYISDNDDPDLLDAGFSPDGERVHAIVGHALPDVAKKYIRSVWIMNSNSLEIVKTIDIGSDNMDECHANFLPVYSHCCRKMALRHRKSIKVYQLPVPDSLRVLCRSVIRRQDIAIEKLSLPDAIKSYLQLKAYM